MNSEEQIDLGIPQIFDDEFVSNYIASYGVALGQMNLGLSRSLQFDISKTDSDCYTKAVDSSNEIEEIFLSKNYSNN